MRDFQRVQPAVAKDPLADFGVAVVQRCFRKLKQWRGIAVRSGKTARSCHAALSLAATLHWLNTGLSNAAQSLHEHSCHALIEARLLSGDGLADEGRRAVPRKRSTPRGPYVPSSCYCA